MTDWQSRLEEALKQHGPSRPLPVVKPNIEIGDIRLVHPPVGLTMDPRMAIVTKKCDGFYKVMLITPYIEYAYDQTVLLEADETDLGYLILAETEMHLGVFPYQIDPKIIGKVSAEKVAQLLEFSRSGAGFEGRTGRPLLWIKGQPSPREVWFTEETVAHNLLSSAVLDWYLEVP